MQLELTENAPFVDNTCAVLDDRFEFYVGVVEFILSPNNVVPAECTIRRLRGYSCSERDITRRTRSKLASESTTVEIDVLVLCNACMTSTGTTFVPTTGRRDVIDQDALAAMGSLLIANHNFSVKATETRGGRGRGSRSRSHRSSSSSSRSSYYCDGSLKSSFSSSTQCGMLKCTVILLYTRFPL